MQVTSERAELLAHPLVSSLLNQKWGRVGRYFFWSSFAFYLLFVIMLTGYIIMVPPSYYVHNANKTSEGDFKGTKGVAWFVDGEDRWIGEFKKVTLYFFGVIGDWIILVLSSINLSREVGMFYKSFI